MQYANGRDIRENINQQLKQMNIKLFDHYKQPFLMDVNEDEETHDELRLALKNGEYDNCLLYTSPSPRDGLLSRMPSSA